MEGNGLEIKNFRKYEDVSQVTLKKYESLLPNDLLRVWEAYGYGTFLDGYLKIINPDEYQQLLCESYFRGGISIPIFLTAFGDVIAWEEKRYLRMIKYKNGSFKGISSGFDFFWEDLIAGEFDEEFFEIKQYSSAVSNLGELSYDECFGYVPLLGLGGNEKIENLKKVKVKEHIELITQLVGMIGS